MLIRRSVIDLLFFGLSSTSCITDACGVPSIELREVTENIDDVKGSCLRSLTQLSYSTKREERQNALLLSRIDCKAAGLAPIQESEATSLIDSLSGSNEDLVDLAPWQEISQAEPTNTLPSPIHSRKTRSIAQDLLLPQVTGNASCTLNEYIDDLDH